MSAQHTPGRLEVDDTGYRAEHNGLCLMIWPECIAVVSAGCLDQPQEANARRLAACWNLLQPFTTEQIESGEADIVALATQRDELLGLLDQMRAMYGPLHNERGEDPPRTFGCHHIAETCQLCEGSVARWKLQRQVAAAIAKGKVGGA